MWYLLRKTGWRSLFLIGLSLFSPLVSNTTYAASGVFTVTARIEPVRIIMVNGSGYISKIISNTTKPTALTAYTATNQPIAITPAIMSQYNSIAKYHNLYKVGVVYELAVSKSSDGKQSESPLNIVTSISLKDIKLSDLFK